MAALKKKIDAVPTISGTGLEGLFTFDWYGTKDIKTVKLKKSRSHYGAAYNLLYTAHGSYGETTTDRLYYHDAEIESELAQIDQEISDLNKRHDDENEALSDKRQEIIGRFRTLTAADLMPKG